MDFNNIFCDLNVRLPEDIQRRKMQGDFAGAVRLIDRKLAEELSGAMRRCLTVQREIIRRMPEDFPYSREEALAAVRERIPDFSEEEFDALVDAGQIRWIYTDGQTRYFYRFFDSMCKSLPDIAIRAKAGLSGAESAGAGSREVDRLDRCIRRMKETGQARIRVRMRASARLNDGQFTPGMRLRVHLPIPLESWEQSEVRIEKVYPESGKIAPADAPQRTVCWEEAMEENHEFSVEYSYTRTARYGAAEGPVVPADTAEQAPHIVFTPYIRALAEELAGDTPDPMEKARRFYDYITLHMKYTYMPEYFCLEDIPTECARSMTGDCGVFALLFITLCRCAGIPARWESGLTAEPDGCGPHDWARFYIPGQGWLYADPSYGISGARRENEERRQFYFGYLDPYRMAANRVFQAPFTVEKSHWRADPYDNQVGEMETADRALRYDEFERGREILSWQEEETA